MQLEDDRARDLANLHFHAAQIQDLASSVLSRLDGKRRRLDARRLQGEGENWLDWQKDEEEEFRKIEHAALSAGTLPSHLYACAAGATVLVRKAAGGNMTTFCDGAAVPSVRSRFGSGNMDRGWSESSALTRMSSALNGVDTPSAGDQLNGNSESGKRMGMARSSAEVSSSVNRSSADGASRSATAVPNPKDPPATEGPTIARTFRQDNEHHQSDAQGGTPPVDIIEDEDDEILRQAGSNRSAKEWAAWGPSHTAAAGSGLEGQGQRAAGGPPSAHARGATMEEDETGGALRLSFEGACNATVPLSTLPSVILQTLQEMSISRRIHNLELVPPSGGACAPGDGVSTEGARVFRLVQRQRTYGSCGELERHEVSFAVLGCSSPAGKEPTDSHFGRHENGEIWC